MAADLREPIASRRSASASGARETVLEVMRAHASRTWPEECCGALLADASGVVNAVPLENAADDRRHAFLVSASDYLRVEAEAEVRGLTLAGFYHSHPDAPAVPSASDAATAWSQWWTVILSVPAGVASAPRAFRFDGTTRRFHEGVLPVG